MKSLIDKIRNKTSNNLYGHYKIIKNSLFKKKYLKLWEKNGCPVPPPHIIKEEIIQNYANNFNIKVLIETGTYLGDMIAALKNKFDLIYSIELGHNLFLNAVKRFKNHKHIILIEGDSSKELKKIIPNLVQPTLFWLDGHYSGGITAKAEKNCPIYYELEAIFSSKVNGNIILIDDARLFNGKDDYPKIEDLINFIKKNNNSNEILIKHDIIRITLNSFETVY